MEYLMIFGIFYFGAIIGSFLNVVILRLPRGLPLSGRSVCRTCGNELKASDLFPLFSFLWLIGKCRQCKANISYRYFIIEALTGLLFVFAWLHSQPMMNIASWLHLVRDLLVVSVLITVFVIDLEHYLILDIVVFPATIVVLLLSLAQSLFLGQEFWHLNNIFLASILGAIIAGLPLYLLWLVSKGKWIGLGDVKFALFLGAVFGWPLLIVEFLLAFLSGGALSVFLLMAKQKTLQSRLPFGTFLSLAALVTLFFGQKILIWYLSVLGF
jgi:leader peptidase (prepilin peptidase)/N-methyltransferase